jgi:hypothetical protein
MSNEGDTMTGTAVEQVEAQDLAERRHLNQVIRTADVMAASSLCRKDLRGKPEDVRAIAITLDQMGIPPGIMNINAGFVVNGRVDFMTKIWTALAQRGGYKVWPDDASDAEAGIAWIRDVATGEEHRVTFTWEDAAKANLTGSDTYKKYGRDMLIWRAMARAVRWHAPEVVAGMVEFDDTPVARPRPRPVPEQAEVDIDEDIVDGEIVEQGEDVVIPGHATAAPGPRTEADDEELAAFIRWKRAGKPRDENGFIVDVPPPTEAPERGPENAAAEIVEPQTAPAPSGPVPGEWRARAAEQGVSDTRLIIMAREVAGAMGLAPPPALDRVTDEVAAGVLERLA